MNDEALKDYSFKIPVVAKSLLNNRCLIFLGAGASRAEPLEGPSLPTATELAAEMATECHLNDFPAYLPLSTIAFYYEFFYSRTFLTEFLKERLDRNGFPIPSTIRLSIHPWPISKNPISI